MSDFRGEEVPFPKLAGIFRLSTKYDIPMLRAKSLELLTDVLPIVLGDTEWLRSRSPQSPWADSDIFKAMAILRECNMPKLLPSLYYMLTRGDLGNLHRKLLGASSGEIQRCILGHDKLGSL